MPSTGITKEDMGDGRKLAEKVAGRIERRIVESGWPVGEIIGSEPALIAELGVSRGVFREAVRLLEHHGSARMRRGPGGGLIVTAPSILAVRRAASLFLQYQRVDMPSLLEARSVLELNCIDLVAKRIRDPYVAARLRRTLDAEVDATTAAGTTRFLRSFHLELADLSGNAAIGLFAEILMELQSEFVNDGQQHAALHELTVDANASHAAHVKIYDALIAGDAEKARSRMAQHLNALTRWTATRAETPMPSTKRSSAKRATKAAVDK